MRIEVRFDGNGDYAISHNGRVIAPGPGPLPAPPLMFLASLAACGGVFAVNYLKARGLPFAGLRVIGEAAHAEDPRRLADIRLTVMLEEPLEDRHLAPLRRAVDLCTLKNTLSRPPEVVAEVQGPVATAQPAW